MTWLFNNKFGQYLHAVILPRPVVVSWDSFLIYSLCTGIAVGFYELFMSKKNQTIGQTDSFTLTIELLPNWNWTLPPPSCPPRHPVLWIWPFWTCCDGCQRSSDTQTHRVLRKPTLDLGCTVGKMWNFKELTDFFLNIVANRHPHSISVDAVGAV